MKKMSLFPLFLLVFGLFWTACDPDETTTTTHKVTCNGKTTTYNNYVKALVQASCSVSGCHDGSGVLNAKDYRHVAGTTAVPAGLKEAITSGGFEKNVLVDNRMPRGSSLPDSILVRLECWFKDGYPE